MRNHKVRQILAEHRFQLNTTGVTHHQWISRRDYAVPIIQYWSGIWDDCSNMHTNQLDGLTKKRVTYLISLKPLHLNVHIRSGYCRVAYTALLSKRKNGPTQSAVKVMANRPVLRRRSEREKNALSVYSILTVILLVLQLSVNNTVLFLQSNTTNGLEISRKR